MLIVLGRTMQFQARYSFNEFANELSANSDSKPHHHQGVQSTVQRKVPEERNTLVLSD